MHLNEIDIKIFFHFPGGDTRGREEEKWRKQNEDGIASYLQKKIPDTPL